ncbi:hypothetical protein [Rhodobaculum claviforme]|uniref:Uncharacterized protein n=1 Tax=Rhodobaculum claviforme TaxID=1549854 RepID=A0A934TK42_9RHOB|nr:hypothetical protein [Rhodobaculum claviforme]MBK5927235.1 hypothetical protein [Rhodobaculum claviforme]
MQTQFEIDGRLVDLTEATSRARELAESITFVDAQIRQLLNEWAIADTARLAYLAAIAREQRPAR